MPNPAEGLIRVDVTVTDKTGQPVVGLTEKDFTVLDNNQPQKIVTFQVYNGGIQPATSFEVVLVIDELNMLANEQGGKMELAAADREAEAFLRANGGVLQHPTNIYRLMKDGLFATSHVSLDGNELADEIEHGGRGRRIWSTSEVAGDIGKIAKNDDGMSRISHSLVALGSIAVEERRRNGRKLVFWIGNGWQVQGRRGTGLSDFSIELLTRMREARIHLWGSSQWPSYDASGNVVPVDDHIDNEYLSGPKKDSIDLGYLSLPVIAARSGGGMLDAARNLAAVIGERVRDEGRYYSISFDPPRTEAVDEYHHLQVEVDKPDTTTYWFKDYYDEPVFYDQAPARQPTTVKELEALIANAHDVSRSELARQLERVELTERVSSSKLAEFEKQVRGREEREALEIVADESAFLAPPADEILSKPPPDAVTQRQIVSNVISFVKTTVPKLPDFIATRTTVQYHETPPEPNQTWKTATGDESQHQGETATASLRFHDGKERVMDENVKGEQPHIVVGELPKLMDESAWKFVREPTGERLQTIGTFGPILVTVMTAATLPRSELEWVRWEQSENGQLAILRYRVSEETPSFTAEFCCLADDFETVPFKESAPFHGEIAVDPSSGAIMRLTIQADLGWRLPLDRSDVMVEYSPVRRGAKVFICPSKSVSISRQRRTVAIDEWGEKLKVYGPFETLLNQMQFAKYHIFGSTSRMLPGFVEVPKKQ